MSQLDAWDLDPIFMCRLWTGKVGNNGRPIVWRGRSPVSAYKLAYELVSGPVAEGLVLDHGCRRVLCVAPYHLEPVTQSENERRKDWGYRCRRKACPMGHSLEHAAVTPERGRLCRVCLSTWKKRDSDHGSGAEKPNDYPGVHPTRGSGS